MPDKTASSPSAPRRAFVAAILIAIILFPVAYSVVGLVFAGGTESPQPFLKPPKNVGGGNGKCILGKDASEMRLHHWELLRRRREEVVRYGLRDGPTLNDCWNCHESRVDFCDRCHQAASVRLDCFGCHYDRYWDESQPVSAPAAEAPAEA